MSYCEKTTKAIGMNDSTIDIRPAIKSLLLSPPLSVNEWALRARNAGEVVFHLGTGQSPFPVHPLIRQALCEHSDKNAYLPVAGLEDLRMVALPYLADTLGFDANDYDIIVGPGSKELIFDLQCAARGDLLLPVPSWVCYAPQAQILGDRVFRIPTTLADYYHITAEELEAAILDATRNGGQPSKLILNYPNNPSGFTLSEDRLKQIADVCRKYRILVISDEIYGLVVHYRRHTSIARYYPEGTVVTTGLSKHLSLGGYRLGVALIPRCQQPLFEALVHLASETWSATSAPIQYAAVKAFEGTREIEDYIRSCTRGHALVTAYVRDIIVNLGVEYPLPHGAFYLYPCFDSFREQLRQMRGVNTSDQLTEDLVRREKVVALPGTAFGDEPGCLSLRLATCDFNGEDVLAYLERHAQPTSTSLVQECCPRIQSACVQLSRYFAALSD